MAFTRALSMVSLLLGLILAHPVSLSKNPPPATGGATTIEVPIRSSSDDAGEGYNCSYSTTNSEIYLGLCRDHLHPGYVASGLRFSGVPLPRNATILDARVRFIVDGPYSDDIVVAVYGEDSGNAEPFSDYGDTLRPLDRPVIPDRVVWWHILPDDSWELGDVRYSPPITSIVQAIVDHPDWQEGNALAIIIKSDGPAAGEWQARRFIAYDRVDYGYGYNGPDNAAVLMVTYGLRPLYLPLVMR